MRDLVTDNKTEVYCCTISKNENFIFAGCHDKRIKCWDFVSGEIIRLFEGHKGLVNCVLLVSNDEFLISGSDDGSLRIWKIFNTEADI